MVDNSLPPIEEILQEFEGGNIPRSETWQSLITGLYYNVDQVNEIERWHESTKYYYEQNVEIQLDINQKHGQVQQWQQEVSTNTSNVQDNTIKAQQSETAAKEAQKATEQARDEVLPLAPAITQLQQQGGRKNLLINGDFAINQRAKTEYVNSDYCLDRWRMWSGGKSQRVFNTSPAQVEFAIRMTKTESGNTFYALIQRLEGMINRLAGKPLTLSFYIRSSRTGYLSAILLNHEKGIDILNEVYAIHAANTWERKEITFPSYPKQDVSDTTLTCYLASNINGLLTNNGDWLEITAVQLEIGETATEFETVHPGTELALCQRYYYRDLNWRYAYQIFNEASPYFGAAYTHPSPMRATPTVNYVYLSGGGDPYPLPTPTGTNFINRLSGYHSFMQPSGYCMYWAEYNAEI